MSIPDVRLESHSVGAGVSYGIDERVSHPQAAVVSLHNLDHHRPEIHPVASSIRT